MEIDPLLHARALLAGEWFGDLDAFGVRFALLGGPLTSTDGWDGVNLTADERSYLAHLAGAIVVENAQGDVRVACFASSRGLHAAWRSLTGQATPAWRASAGPVSSVEP